MKRTKAHLPSGLHALLWKEGKWFVAKCVEVEVASQGKTKKEALDNLGEAVGLFFDDKVLPNPPIYQDIELLTMRSLYA